MFLNFLATTSISSLVYLICLFSLPSVFSPFFPPLRLFPLSEMQMNFLLLSPQLKSPLSGDHNFTGLWLYAHFLPTLLIHHMWPQGPRRRPSVPQPQISTILCRARSSVFRLIHRSVWNFFAKWFDLQTCLLPNNTRLMLLWPVYMASYILIF